MFETRNLYEAMVVDLDVGDKGQVDGVHESQTVDETRTLD